MMILRLLVTAITLFLADAEDINCNYTTHSVHGYGCVAANMNSINITGVCGKHETGKSNLYVSYVEMSSRVLHFFPVGIYNQFPNVTALSLHYDQLRELTQNDLRPFGKKLTFLSISTNSYGSLSSNMFESTLNIKHLTIIANITETMEFGVFKNLHKLETLVIDFSFIKINVTNPAEVTEGISELNLYIVRRNESIYYERCSTPYENHVEYDYKRIGIVVCLLGIIAIPILFYFMIT